MARLLFLLTLFTFSFSRAQSGSTQLDSVSVNGSFRYFYLYIPTSYNGSTAYPLVLNLHGLSSNALQQQVYSNFMPIADTAGFLIVHPEGSKNGTVQYWNAGIVSSPDDLLFLLRMIDTICSKYMVDPSRVYSCGLSNGGLMSYYLACQAPKKIAAIASVAGTMLRPWFLTCKPLTAMPVMEIHGTEDGTVPYEGNSSGTTAGMYLPIDSVIYRWALHDQCNMTPKAENLPDLVPGDQSTVSHQIYAGGLDGSSVELYKVVGGSHSWPGATPVIYKTNQDFSASLEIWRFFRKYRSAQFTQPVGLDEQSSALRWFPNPVQDRMYLEAGPGNTLRVFSGQGDLLIGQHSAYAGQKEAEIDLRQLKPGIYVLEVSGNGSVQRLKFIKD